MLLLASVDCSRLNPFFELTLCPSDMIGISKKPESARTSIANDTNARVVRHHEGTTQNWYIHLHEHVKANADLSF
jgi:hypothetical protein